MPTTYGFATGDDQNLLMVGGASSGRALFFAGWFLPTTLTAGRRYCGTGGTWGVAISTTTSEIDFIGDFATTDSLHTSSGAGISTNTWYFLAVLFTGASAAVDWRAWRGTVEVEPALLSLTQITAPVGSLASSNAWAFGNQGSAGTQAWEGDIGHANVAMSDGDGTTSPFGLSTGGSISAEAEGFTFRRHVLPAWRNNWPLAQAQANGVTGFVYAPLIGRTVTGHEFSSASSARSSNITLSSNGVTYSLNSAPRAYTGMPFTDFVRR